METEENVSRETNEENISRETNEENVSRETNEENAVTPSVEELNKALEDALVENATLKQRLEAVTRERDEANALFLGSGRASEEKERTYNDIIGDIKR